LVRRPKKSKPRGKQVWAVVTRAYRQKFTEKLKMGTSIVKERNPPEADLNFRAAGRRGSSGIARWEKPAKKGTGESS